jgi:hypothetical protein
MAVTWREAVDEAFMRAQDTGFRYVVRRSYARPVWLVMRKVPNERVRLRGAPDASAWGAGWRCQGCIGFCFARRDCVRRAVLSHD